MRKRLYLVMFIIIFIVSSHFSYAIENIPDIPDLKKGDIYIYYEDREVYILNNKNSIIIKEGKPIKFKINEENIMYPKDEKEVLNEFYIEILDGKLINTEKGDLISEGVLYIDTNLGEILIDEDGIFLHNKNTFKVDNDFEIKASYNDKFTKEYRRILELKEATNKINYNLINLEKEFQNLRTNIIEKYEENSKKNSYENEQLITKVQSLEQHLEVSRREPNIKAVNSNPNSNPSTTVVQDNIYKNNKGNLQVIAEVPKSFEELNQDIFIELENVDDLNQVKLYYMSNFNSFKNTHQLEIGDYRVKSIFFLDPSLDKKYEFQHNSVVKVLENETTYFLVYAIDLLDIDGDIKEDLLFEDIAKEENFDNALDDSLDINKSAKSEKSKKGFAIFLGLILVISLFLIWKFDVINKIIYKE